MDYGSLESKSTQAQTNLCAVYHIACYKPFPHRDAFVTKEEVQPQNRPFFWSPSSQTPFTMGLPLLFGSLLIAIGPSAIFFVTTVSRRPYLLIAALFGYLLPSYTHSQTSTWDRLHAHWRNHLFHLEHLGSIIGYNKCDPLGPNPLGDPLDQHPVPRTAASPCIQNNGCDLRKAEQSQHSSLHHLSDGTLQAVSVRRNGNWIPQCAEHVRSCSLLHRRSLVTLTSAGHNADYYMPQCDCISIYILTALECLFIMPMHVAWSYLTLSDYSQKYRTFPALVAVWHLATGACVSPVVRVSWYRRCSTECPMAASSLSSFSSSRLFSLSSSSHAKWLEVLIF